MSLLAVWVKDSLMITVQCISLLAHTHRQHFLLTLTELIVWDWRIQPWAHCSGFLTTIYTAPPPTLSQWIQSIAQWLKRKASRLDINSLKVYNYGENACCFLVRGKQIWVDFFFFLKLCCRNTVIIQYRVKVQSHACSYVKSVIVLWHIRGIRAHQNTCWSNEGLLSTYYHNLFTWHSWGTKEHLCR